MDRFAMTIAISALGLGIFAVACSGAQRAGRLGASDVDALPSSTPTLSASYGDGPLHVGDLRLPAGKGPFPVVVVVHGGCWTKGFATRQNTAALATALTQHGFATWNIEYRQLGDAGSGWPGTFQDWAAATDYLRELARTQPLDLTRVASAGHSAGANAAAWLLVRPNLPAGSEIRGKNPLPVQSAIVIDGPGELQDSAAVDGICGDPDVEHFLDGTPATRPERYKLSDPLAWGHVGPQLFVGSRVITEANAAAYAAKAKSLGDEVETLHVGGAGHFEPIAPQTEAWKTQVEGPMIAFLNRTLHMPPLAAGR